MCIYTSLSLSLSLYIYIYTHTRIMHIIRSSKERSSPACCYISFDWAYTRSPSQDFRLFGPRPWKILATYEKMGSWATQTLAKILWAGILLWRPGVFHLIGRIRCPGAGFRMVWVKQTLNSKGWEFSCPFNFIGSLPESSARGLLVGKLLVGGLGVEGNTIGLWA